MHTIAPLGFVPVWEAAGGAREVIRFMGLSQDSLRPGRHRAGFL
jgi:hypothetical protein